MSRSRYEITEADKLSVEEVEANIQRRLASVIAEVARLRQALLNPSDYMLFFTELVQSSGNAIVVKETVLHLYRLWINYGPQQAVNEAFALAGDRATSTSPWTRAVVHARAMGALNWLSVNTLELQSLEISWHKAIARM